MKMLYIIRGPFGTGKTEFARTITDNVVSCWDYYAQYGQNTWNEKLKPHADEYCRNSVKTFMLNGAETVAVTNSFSLNSDLDYYYDLAAKNGYQVFCMIMDNRNTQDFERDVPQEVVKDQAQRITTNLQYYSAIS